MHSLLKASRLERSPRIVLCAPTPTGSTGAAKRHVRFRLYGRSGGAPNRSSLAAAGRGEAGNPPGRCAAAVLRWIIEPLIGPSCPGLFPCDGRVRVDLHTLRARLGVNPATGRYFVPNATNNPEAQLRNDGVYLVEELLCDANRFRRLRLRGEAAGAGGIDDLAEALRLVTGAPYEQLRRRGGLWLAKSRDDQHLLVGIIDVAHLLTTHALATADLTRAWAAAELAHAIAPGEVTPQLDLAVIAEHEGSPAAADRIARDALDWLDGTGEGPLDIGHRADTILRAHRRLERYGRVN